MSAPVESSFSMLDVCRGLFRHKWKAGALFVVTCGLVAFIAARLPNTYCSEAKLFFSLGPESGTDPATSQNHGGVNYEDPREGMINSAIDILRSRELLEKVVDQVGSETILTGETCTSCDQPSSIKPDYMAAAKGLVKSALNMPELSQRERAIQNLEKSVRISTQRRSYVVSISCKSPSRHVAQQICRALVDSYRTHHVEIHRSAESVEQLQRSLAETDQSLIDARQALQQRLNEVGSAPEIQRNIVQGRKRQHQATLRELLTRNQQLAAAGPWTTTDPSVVPEGSLDPEQLAALHVAPSLQSEFVRVSQKYADAVNLERFFQQHELAVAEWGDRITRLKDQAESLEKRLAEAKLEAHLGEELVSSVRVAQQPTLQQRPVGPKRSLIMALGVMLAITASVGVVFIAEVFDGTLRTTQDVEKQLGLPVLVSIPRKNNRAFHLN